MLELQGHQKELEGTGSSFVSEAIFPVHNMTYLRNALSALCREADTQQQLILY